MTAAASFHQPPKVEVPVIDIVSYSFQIQSDHVDDNKPLFINAADPSQSLNATQIRTLVIRLIAGLRARGFKRGDSVLLPLPNNVSNLSRT
jgi:non-ribosomal peptide synthetase component E (peptide arylation enzyme)